MSWQDEIVELVERLEAVQGHLLWVRGHLHHVDGHEDLDPSEISKLDEKIEDLQDGLDDLSESFEDLPDWMRPFTDTFASAIGVPTLSVKVNALEGDVLDLRREIEKEVENSVQS